MNGERKSIKTINKQETGAALVTVLMISVLLGIACVAMLSAVGQNSKNSTDVLSEAKAYYAAESGLQASIDVFRNKNGANYSTAITDPDLSTWLPTYNCTNNSDGNASISVGPNPCDLRSGTSYRINVTDPDNSQAFTTFSTVGGFTNSYAASVTFQTSESIKTILTFDNVSNCTISFAANSHCAPNENDPNPLLSTLRITNVGNGVQLPTTNAGGLRFAINYTITNPSRVSTRTIRGTIAQDNPGGNIAITFDTNTYSLAGTEIKLCQTSTTDPCVQYSLSIPPPSVDSFTTAPIYMNTTPLEPYRLKVESVGYGPNGAKKHLEGIIQKNFFNDIGGSAALTMQGSSIGLVFDPGNSSVFEINGVDDGNGVIVPSVGVIDQPALDTVNSGIPNNNDNITPAPAVINDVPPWMATPQNLNTFIQHHRVAAQNSGRYFAGGTTLTNVGDFNSGTGITFCEGNCKAGVDGGGILIVTGQLTNVGGWRFKGLIIITGAEGWLRNGAGNGTVIGNVVIAPYTSSDLATNTWSLPPKYKVQGGGTSGLEYDGQTLDFTFDGTTAISNFMLGVAEK